MLHNIQEAVIVVPGSSRGRRSRSQSKRQKYLSYGGDDQVGMYLLHVGGTCSRVVQSPQRNDHGGAPCPSL